VDGAHLGADGHGPDGEEGTHLGADGHGPERVEGTHLAVVGTDVAETDDTLVEGRVPRGVLSGSSSRSLPPFPANL